MCLAAPLFTRIRETPMPDAQYPPHSLEQWLVLSQYYPPEVGAPQIRLRCLVRELRRNGKSVLVRTAMPNYPTGKIFPGYNGKLFRTDWIDDVEVRRTWAYAATGPSTWARFWNYCCFALMVMPSVLFGRRPDVCFVEAQPLPLGIVALLMKYLRGVPFIYNVPDLQVDVARELGFLRSDLALGFARYLETLLLRNAMTVSTVSDGFIKHFEMRGIPRNQITFLPNGADSELLRPRLPAPEFIEQFGLRDKLAFVYVGTHAYYHGLDTLIMAAELLQDDPRIRIVMVGHGPERDRIRSMVETKALSNVMFGDVPYESTADLYSVAYAAVATLRDLPVAAGMRLSKIFPALSCGVPVIYSGAGEAAELLAAQRCGFATPPEDPRALASVIRDLAAAPALRAEFGMNGRRYVEEQYSWSTIVQRWLLTVGRVRASGEHLVPEHSEIHTRYGSNVGSSHVSRQQ